MEFKKIPLDIDYEKLGLEKPDVTPCLECYLPADASYKEMKIDKLNNTILILPGGGYGMLSSREHDPIAFQFLAAGFTVFALKYSVKPYTFPTALFEAYTAISMIRKNAEEWLVDTNRISVCGFSAGGHLTACTGAYMNEKFVKDVFGDTDEYKPNALVLSYPVITAGEYAHKGSFKNLLGKEELSEEDIAYHSIENRITADFPPSFVWHTAEDNAVPVMNSLLLCQEFAKNKVKFELHIYPEGPHGLALSNHITEKSGKFPAPEKPRAWVKECVDFLDNIAYNN